MALSIESTQGADSSLSRSYEVEVHADNYSSPTAKSTTSFKNRSPIKRKPLPASACVVPPARGDSLKHKRRPNSDADQGVPVLMHGTPQSVTVHLAEEDYFQPHRPSIIPLETGERSTFIHASSFSLPRITEEIVGGRSRASNVFHHTNDSLKNSFARVGDMALKLGTRPPPLRMDSTSSTRSLGAGDGRKPQTPGSKFTSFFSRNKITSPSVESSVTEISDSTKSPAPSSYPPSPGPIVSPPRGSRHLLDGITSQSPQAIVDQDRRVHAFSPSMTTLSCKCAQLEAELREITTELAGSIKREMDLEDMVDKFQSEAGTAAMNDDRTSDYYSDSGTSSIRYQHEFNVREEMAKVRREADQTRAQLRIDLTQKWQAEVVSRKQLESHVQILESRLSQTRQTTNDSTDMMAKSKELETAVEDMRRRLVEERRTKENFEDLLTALRVELEQNKNQRDNLRDEVVPQLRSQIEGLEASLADALKSSYDVARMQQEMQVLKDENLSLSGSRNSHLHLEPANEDISSYENSPRNSSLMKSGLQRSNTNTLNRSRSTNARNRSNSISRSNENSQSLSDQLKAVEMQRDALHSTVKYLLRRNDYQNKNYEKRLKMISMDSFKSNPTAAPRKGYEREVNGLRAEINLLRKRADDALEQKWQCEKGLTGLALDLDRSRQETNRLQQLLQARDDSAPEALSASLQQSLHSLQQPSQALAQEVEEQMHANSLLRNRLKEGIAEGERNQQQSAAQINELQMKLRKLEDVITSAQIQSETAVMKHEEELRILRASHNMQLSRTQTIKSPGLLTPGLRSPMSPMFANSKKSPRLDKTSTGLGIPLHEALKTEHLENKVAELEKALAEADDQMQEVVSRMNSAQIGAAELEAERDEALRRTRQLEAAIRAERERS